MQIQPQEIPEGPWQIVGVDLVRPLPLSKGKDRSEERRVGKEC